MMITELNQVEKQVAELPVFGVEEMLISAGNTPLHSLNTKDMADYGELCDADCVDCD